MATYQYDYSCEDLRESLRYRYMARQNLSVLARGVAIALLAILAIAAFTPIL
jgi:hypothetical protein